MPVDVTVPPDIRALWDELGNTVVKYPDPSLRRTAKPVKNIGPQTQSLVERMATAMIGSNGIGLAAPQLGVSERVIVYRLPEENSEVHAIVNPRIVSHKGEQIGPEGCLSLPMLHGDVKRAYEVVVKGLDASGRPIRRRATDMEARVIQHEYDHLDGVLFIDRADPETLVWHVPTEEEEFEEDLVS
jgi:peptide deformylase